MTREPDLIAESLLAALDGVRSMPPLTAGRPDFDVAAATRVAHAVTALRMRRGERPVGRKIGFTNRTIWDEYGVYAPIWGPVYDTTLREVRGPAAGIGIGHLVEPRIEPEIVFRFAAPPMPSMDEAALLACIDGVAHGYEIVQSLFPDWRFQAADCVAAFGLHGMLLTGPFVRPDAGWLEPLAQFRILLSRDGGTVDEGRAANVLDGPLSALRHFVGVLDADPQARPVAAGEVVTTGTVTRAFPIAPGERWTTRVEGLPLAGMDVTFA